MSTRIFTVMMDHEAEYSTCRSSLGIKVEPRARRSSPMIVSILRKDYELVTSRHAEHSGKQWHFAGSARSNIAPRGCSVSPAGRTEHFDAVAQHCYPRSHVRCSNKCHCNGYASCLSLLTACVRLSWNMFHVDLLRAMSLRCSGACCTCAGHGGRSPAAASHAAPAPLCCVHVPSAFGAQSTNTSRGVHLSRSLRAVHMFVHQTWTLCWLRLPAFFFLKARHASNCVQWNPS